MALDLEEQEQLEALKAWWRQYGKWVIAGVAAFVLAVGGSQGWRYWQAKQASEAAVLFERAMQAASLHDTKTLKEVTAQIMDHYPRTAYSTPAAWLAGRANLEAGDLKSARAQYQFALEHARDERLEELARLRLASVLFEDGDLDGALKLLAKEPAPAYAGLFAQLRGDILVAQGKPSEARAAYAQALERLAADSALRSLVEIKLDALGG